MPATEQAIAMAETPNTGFFAVELGLALDLTNPVDMPFDDCVRNAASVVGGELLFDMPSDGSLEDASRIAAVRTIEGEANDIVFAILNAEGTEIRVCGREELGDRFHGFAKAFVGVLTRIREELPIQIVETEGNA